MKKLIVLVILLFTNLSYAAADLEKENKKLKIENEQLRDELNSYKEFSAHKTFGLGAGALIPINGGSPHFATQINLLGLQGYYYFLTGGGFNLNPRIMLFQSHLRLRPIGVGLMFYHNTPLTTEYVDREIDINLKTGFDVRLFSGFEVRVSATWFLPDPVNTSNYVEKRINVDNNSNLEQEELKSRLNNSVRETMDGMGEVYLEALKMPYIEVVTAWEF